ncbi:hypothetical protein P3S68_015412 [Capsicum galapagoense]
MGCKVTFAQHHPDVTLEYVGQTLHVEKFVSRWRTLKMVNVAKSKGSAYALGHVYSTTFLMMLELLCFRMLKLCNCLKKSFSTSN